ncbi:uncharacterized protein LOC134188638 [Corticium candelabrum]|uniref:uncharacterized protein LOC134188638 n=1 Tax=Corticium candelabrum TaxID=121492 RepID=UPI002E2566E2|nr:uncharacterized protein LOC134188638 [Corticium candelabrum]
MNEGFLGARGNRPENGNGPTFPRQVGALGTAANGVYAERAREEDVPTAKEPDYVNLRHLRQRHSSLTNASQEPQRQSPEQTVQRQNSGTYENMLRRDYMGTRSDEHRQPSDMDSHTGKEPLPSMETPAVMPKGPVAVASDNPSYTLERAYPVIKGIMEERASSGYDSVTEYIPEPAIAVLKSDIRPDNGPCNVSSDVTLVLPNGFLVHTAQCKVHWRGQETGLSCVTHGKVGVNKSCVYTCSPKWPDPEKVTVLLEGVNASVDLHTLGDFTFTRLTPTRRFPFSFQCPNGSPPGRSAEETLKQVYQVLNDQYFNPSMSGTSSQAGGHHPTCSETNTNNDENGLSQPSGENDAAQKLLQVLSLLEPFLLENSSDHTDEENGDSPSVMWYRSVNVVPPNRNLSLTDVDVSSANYAVANDIYPASTGIVAPKLLQMEGSKFTTMLEEVRDRVITVDKAVEKGRTYTYNRCVDIQLPDHVANSKKNDSASKQDKRAKIGMKAGSKIARFFKLKKDMKKDVKSNTSSESGSITEKLQQRPPHPPPKPKKPRKPSKELDTDESTTYHVSLSSGISKDSIESADKTQVPTVKSEAPMKRLSSVSQIDRKQQLVSEERYVAIRSVDDSNQEPIYMNQTEIIVNKQSNCKEPRKRHWQSTPSNNPCVVTLCDIDTDDDLPIKPRSRRQSIDSAFFSGTTETAQSPSPVYEEPLRQQLPPINNEKGFHLATA